MSCFGRNIKKIRSVKKLSQQSFAELFDLKRGTLGAYEEGRSEPKIDTIIKIANHFSIQIDSLLKNELTVNELLQFKGDLTTYTEQLKREQFAEIPCIRDNNSTEYISSYDKKDFIKELPVLQLPINQEKEFRAYTVSNLEMTNHDTGFYPKDIVVGEKVPLNIIKKLNNNTLVFSLVNDALIFRRLYVTKNEITLRADHKNIEDVSYPISDVKEMWRIRYVFCHRIPEFTDVVHDKINTIEIELEKIKKKLS